MESSAAATSGPNAENGAAFNIRPSSGISAGGAERAGLASSRTWSLSPSGRRPWKHLRSFLHVPVEVLDTLLPITLPTSFLRRAWTLWTLALVIFIAVDVPLQIGFESYQQLVAIRTMSWVTTVSFCIDVIVNFRTAYTTDRGELVRSPRSVAAHYLRGLFLLDLLSALPFQQILDDTSFRRNAVWFSLLKLPRLFRLARHIDEMTRTKFVNLVGVARLLLVMIFITHWAACLWHFLAAQIPGWPWVFSMQCAACPDSEEYTFAFYRCFLLMLGDKPDTFNNVERVFAVALLSLGACLYAVVVSSITMLVSNMWSMAARHTQRAAMLQDALRYNEASHDMRVRVDAYYNFMASYNHPGPDGVSMLSELPAALHAELLSTVFERMLVTVQLFAHCERPFLWRLAQRLRLVLYMAGDIIYDVGSVGHDMYIIWKGAVGLLEPDGNMAALLSDNDHFGELGVMTASTPRPHRAVALQKCDVMALARWDLQDAMRDFPDSATLVKGRARVQLEDHEVVPAVWAATVATGQAQQHELHPPPAAAAVAAAAAAAFDGGRSRKSSGRPGNSRVAADKSTTGHAMRSDLPANGGAEDQEDAGAGEDLRSTLQTLRLQRPGAVSASTNVGLRCRARRKLHSSARRASADGSSAGPVAEATDGGQTTHGSESLEIVPSMASMSRRTSSVMSCSSEGSETLLSILFSHTGKQTMQAPVVDAIPGSQMTTSRAHISPPCRRAQLSPTSQQSTRKAQRQARPLSMLPEQDACDPAARPSTAPDNEGSRRGGTSFWKHAFRGFTGSTGGGASTASQAPVSPSKLQCGSGSQQCAAEVACVRDTTTTIATVVSRTNSMIAGGDGGSRRGNRDRRQLVAADIDDDDIVPAAGGSIDGRRTVSKAQLLVLHPQPWLGLDPLGPLYETSTRPTTTEDLSTHQRGLLSPDGDPSVSAAHRRHSFVSGETYDASVTGRRGALFMSQRGLQPARKRDSAAGMARSWRRGRFASEGGYHCEGYDGSVRQGKATDSSAAAAIARCEQLEEQLKEAHAQISAMLQNPLQVPAMAAAFRREVDGLTSRLNACMAAQLQQVLEALNGMKVRTEDLALQVAAADDSMQRLEEEHVGFSGSTDSPAAVSGLGSPAAAGVAGSSPILDPQGLDVRDVLPDGTRGATSTPPLLGTKASTNTEQLGLLLTTLSMAGASAAGRPVPDGGRFALSTQQLSRRSSRVVSARGAGGVPLDSSPVTDMGSAGGGGLAPAIEVSAPPCLSLEEATLLAVTMQRAVKGTRRRSVWEGLNLVALGSMAQTPAGANSSNSPNSQQQQPALSRQSTVHSHLQSSLSLQRHPGQQHSRDEKPEATEWDMDPLPLALDDPWGAPPASNVPGSTDEWLLASAASPVPGVCGSTPRRSRRRGSLPLDMLPTPTADSNCNTPSSGGASAPRTCGAGLAGGDGGGKRTPTTSQHRPAASPWTSEIEPMLPGEAERESGRQ